MLRLPSLHLLHSCQGECRLSISSTSYHCNKADWGHGAQSSAFAKQLHTFAGKPSSADPVGAPEPSAAVSPNGNKGWVAIAGMRCVFEWACRYTSACAEVHEYSMLVARKCCDMLSKLGLELVCLFKLILALARTRMPSASLHSVKSQCSQTAHSDSCSSRTSINRDL
jgi:hypothetical protein